MHDEYSLTRLDSFGTAGRRESDLAGNLIDYAVRRQSRGERDVRRMRSGDLTSEKARVGGAISEAPEAVPDAPSEPAFGKSSERSAGGTRRHPQRGCGLACCDGRRPDFTELGEHRRRAHRCNSIQRASSVSRTWRSMSFQAFSVPRTSTISSSR